MQGVRSFIAYGRLRKTATIFEGKGHEKNRQFYMEVFSCKLNNLVLRMYNWVLQGKQHAVVLSYVQSRCLAEKSILTYFIIIYGAMKYLALSEWAGRYKNTDL